MKNLKYILLAAVLATPLTAHAQVLVSYGYPGAAASGSGDPVAAPAPVSNTPDATGSTYVGTGLGPTGNSFFPGYLTFDPDTSSTLSDAVTNKTFYSFTITPTAGDALTLTKFDLSTTSLYTNTNNGTIALESSVSGFGSGTTNVLATYSPTTMGNSVTLAGPGYVDDTKPIEFRLYVYGGNPYYVDLQGGPLNIDGAASLAPEPSTWMLLGLGLGGLLLTARCRRPHRVGLHIPQNLV